MTDSLVWRELVLPPVLSGERVDAALVGLAGLSGRPRIVLEAAATAGRIRWRIGADTDMAIRQAVRQLGVHLPDCSVQPVANWPTLGGDDSCAAVAGQLAIRGSRSWPGVQSTEALGDRDGAAVSRGLLGALAAAGRGEVLRYQVVLGARSRPRRPSKTRGGEHPRREQIDHQTLHGFGCVIRIGAGAQNTGRCRLLVQGVVVGLTGLEAPGIVVGLRATSLNSLTRAASPFLWPLHLSVEDLVPLTAWPVAEDPKAELPGLPPRHPRVLLATNAHPTEGVVIGKAVSTTGKASERDIAQPPQDALRHRHALGPTGVGKSTLLGTMVLQDIQADRGAVVIDPKGDLITDLLARIPQHRQDDVVVLDAASSTPFGINPLSGADPDLAADSVVTVYHSLYGEGLGPRSTDILHSAVLTLARAGDDRYSLACVPLLLTNPGFRRKVTAGVHAADPLGLGAFWAGFEALKPGEQDTITRPLLNKLRPIMLRPSLRTIFGQCSPAISLEQILATKKILLVKLRKDAIGVEASQLLGSLLVAQLWRAILARASLPEAERHPVMVIIDEVQDYLRLPGSLADALAQARGLGASITAAHQYLGQLGKLEDDLSANTASKLYFRLSSKDAAKVTGQSGYGRLVAEDFAHLPRHQLYAQLLVDGDITPWVSVATNPFPPALRNPATLQAHSEARYGQTRDAVEAELLAFVDRPTSPAPAADQTATDSGTRFGRRRPTPAASDQPTRASNPLKGGTP